MMTETRWEYWTMAAMTMAEQVYPPIEESKVNNDYAGGGPSHNANDAGEGGVVDNNRS